MVLQRLGHLLLATLLTLAISAYADDQPCTLHHGGNFYDLSPLKARCASIETLDIYVDSVASRKDYELDIEGGRKFYLNVCRGITTDPWNAGVSEGDGDIAGLIRRDHGDFAIG